VTDNFFEKSIQDVRRALAARFSAAGIESPELDARLLLGAALGLDLTGLIVAAERPLAEQEAARLETFAARRLQGEPVARILAVKEFWGLPLKLSHATLVPRPDTETVVELALEALRSMPLPHGARIADLGTGSGAILLALLHELPDATGVGTDTSVAALKAAKANATALGLLRRARFVACDYAAALRGPFELVVSNPPYIRTADIQGLAGEVRNHDPLAALDGGVDGLDAYRRLIPQAAGLLVPGGVLAVETGYDQSAPVAALMAAEGLTVDGPARTDLGGVLRAVAARKMPP
jgi:release factor glutamine methyltransferase